MNYRNLVPVIGTIISVTNMREECCNTQISIMTANGVVNAVINTETVVIDSQRMRVGMYVVVFYDETLPVPLIFPPRYQAVLVSALRQNQEIMLNFFNGQLLSEDGMLRLNVGNQTNVTTVNGQRFQCNTGNRVLLVYYTVTTRSIPPQTTPERIVVFC